MSDTPADAPRIVSVPCPLCGAEDREPRHEAVDRWMGVPGRFRYARCLSCDQVYLWRRPAPEDLGRYYPDHYIHRGRGPGWLLAALRRRDLAPKIRLLGRVAAPGARVLDVGCAEGDFLDEARAAGYVTAGVEPTPWAAARAAARGLPIWESTAAAAPLPDEAFDVATLWDVVEHLPRPGEDLARVARALRPGGRLLLSTPVRDGWEARLWGEDWPGWDTPRHLVVFDRAGLDALLRRAGFRPVAVTHTFESYLISALALTLLARERLPRPWPAVVRTALHLRPLRWAMRPLFSLLDRRLGGCALTWVAVREPEVAA